MSLPSRRRFIPDAITGSLLSVSPWGGRQADGQRLSVAVALPLLAFALQCAFWPNLQPFVWLLFYPAVFFSASVGGLPGGLLATLLSTVLGWYGFIPPRFSFSLEAPQSGISAGIFLIMGLLIALTHGRLRAAESLAAEAKLRTRLAEAKQESEQRLELIIETMAECLMITDRDGRFTLVNAAAEAHVGLDRANIIGTRYDQVPWQRLRLDGSALPNTEHPFARIMRDGAAIQNSLFKIRRISDGVIRTVSANARPLRNASGAIDGIVATYNDVTELELHRTNLEHLIGVRTAELQDANNKLQDTQFAMDQVGIAIHWVEVETGRFLYVNSVAAEMLGYRVEEMLGLAVPDITPNISAGGFKEAVADFRQKYRTAFETTLTTKDGRDIPCEVILHFLPGNDAMPERFITFVTDITKRKITEAAHQAALNEAERLAILRRDFLANMSHEIRTPLNAVLGLAQIGARDNTGRKCQTVFTRILTAGQGLLGVIDDILDFSKIESGKMQVEIAPFNIGDVIDRSAHLIALQTQAKGLHVTIEESPDLPTGCLGDAKRLQQVLDNLLSNAVKFTPQGGAVTLSARRDGEELVFHVSDTGIGIAPDAIERLFLPFEQTDGSTTRKFGGTGLGLPISRQLAEMMGGEITVLDQPGQGVCFEVRLPLTGAVARAPKPDRPLVLYGLPADEIEAIRRVIAVCPSLAPLDPVPNGTAMIVIDAAALADDAVRTKGEEHLVRGRRVAVVVPDDHFDLPSALWNRAAILERPLRVRHILTALSAPQNLSPQTDRRPRLGGLSILSAEDNEINRLILEDILRCEGARMTSVENGQSALDCLRQQDRQAFDLVLTDIQMPGMDGYALARAITSLAPGLPVIGLTAHAMQEERTRCLAAGMVDHVSKPIDLDVLVAAILRHTRPIDGTPPLPVIDWPQLESRYSGRYDFIKRLLGLVVATHAGTPQQLREALAAGDIERLAKLAHSLKSTAGNLAADGLQSLASHTERAVRDGLSETAGLVENLAKAVEALLSAIALRES